MLLRLVAVIQTYFLSNFHGLSTCLVPGRQVRSGLDFWIHSTGIDPSYLAEPGCTTECRTIWQLVQWWHVALSATFQGDAFLFMCFFVNNQHSRLAQPAAIHQCFHQGQMIPPNCPATSTSFISFCRSIHIIYILIHQLMCFTQPHSAKPCHLPQCNTRNLGLWPADW